MELSKEELAKILRLKYLAVFVSVMIIGTMIGAVAIGIDAVNRFQGVEIGRLDYHTENEEKGLLLGQIREHFGYGGLIHNFKDFMITGNMDAVGVIERDFSELRASITNYGIIGNSENESKALAKISSVIDAYESKLWELIGKVYSGQSPLTLGKFIVIDDKPALAAMSALEVIWIEARNAETINVHNTANEGQKRIMRGFFFLPILALSAVFLMWFLRQLTTEISTRLKIEVELREARKLADTANKAKSQFLSSMSHELRTPLNAILGFSQMLELDIYKPLSSEQRDCVNHITQGGQHLLELVNDVLDLSKIESGQIRLSFEDVIPMDFCKECLSLASPLAQKRGIVISLQDVGIDMQTVRADYTRCVQILLNLVTNAIKYNRDGGEVIIETKKSSGNKLRFYVTDKGHGIDVDKQKDLFKPFNRLGAETTEIEGTGIGLVITKQLVEMMGGEIGFESEAGKGSVFWFELPLALEHKTQESTRPITEEFAIDLEKAALSVEGTMLYVEDNPANLKLMELIVKRMPKLSMISAHNAELGIELAEVHKPDLILMDINLPGINGYEALKRINENKTTNHIPVIALTARATRSDIEKGIKAGFHDYLTKPIRVDTTLRVIKSAIDMQA